MRTRRIVEVLVLLSFVFATNQWMPMERGIQYLQADDSRSYLLISRAAPAFPTLDANPAAYHHAQRFVPHWLIGASSRITHADLGLTYHAGTVLLALLLAFLAQEILLQTSLGDGARRVLLAVFLWNPYTLRYYLLVPSMLADLLFGAGLAWILLGLLRMDGRRLGAGAALSTLGRQSTLLVLPGIWAWVTFASQWRSRSLWARAALAVGVSLLVIVFYRALGAVALSFSTLPLFSPNLFFSLIPWLFDPSFHIRTLAEHLLRVFVPTLPCLTLLGASWASGGFGKLRAETFASLLVAAGLIAQPLLVNPLFMEQNQSRQSAIAMLPLLTAAALQLRGLQFRASARAWAVLATGALLTSFHHLYTVVGPATAGGYLAFYAVGCALLGIGTYLSTFSASARSAQD